MQGSAVPTEADGPCISENNNEISPEILYRNEKENQQNRGLVRNITGTITGAAHGKYLYMSTSGVFTNTLITDEVGNAQGSGKVNEITFNANRSVTTSSENRPINISAIPLIVAK